MEAMFGSKRDSWPIEAVRRFSDVLIDVAAGRRKSPRHELRWLNLYGFCLRPGFGGGGDDARAKDLQKVAATELVFVDDLQCQIERLVMLRRIAGGINASKQQQLYRKRRNTPGQKKGRPNRQLEYDSWRLLASLEHLPASFRASLGHELLAKISKEPEDAIWLWSLSRLGARIPLYGPLHSVVAAETAGEWLQFLLTLDTFTALTASAVVAMARRTGDSSRDIDDAIREQAISRLGTLGVAEGTIELVSTYFPPGRADALRSFGESLPPGFQVLSSASCLLSLPALHNSNPAETSVNRRE